MQLSELLLMYQPTDGGSWRSSSAGMNSLLKYPDYLLDDTFAKKAKL